MLRNPARRREQRLIRKVNVMLTPSVSYSQVTSTNSGAVGMYDSTAGVWKPYGRVGLSVYPLTVSNRERY